MLSAEGGGFKPEGRPGKSLVLTPEAAALQPLSVMLGRPTDKSITANVLAAEEREGFIEYGTAAGQYTAKTAVTKFPAGAPVELLVEGLKGDTRYFYRLSHRKPGEEAFTAGAERSFSTQRAPGSAFTFEIQGDSHPERAEKMYDPALYTKTLLAAAADKEAGGAGGRRRRRREDDRIEVRSHFPGYVERRASNMAGAVTMVTGENLGHEGGASEAPGNHEGTAGADQGSHRQARGPEGQG